MAIQALLARAHQTDRGRLGEGSDPLDGAVLATADARVLQAKAKPMGDDGVTQLMDGLLAYQVTVHRQISACHRCCIFYTLLRPAPTGNTKRDLIHRRRHTLLLPATAPLQTVPAYLAGGQRRQTT